MYTDSISSFPFVPNSQSIGDCECVRFNGKVCVPIFNYYIKSRTHRITGKIDIDWSQTLRKKARGTDDCDLGRVQEVRQDHVVTKKGVVST